MLDILDNIFAEENIEYHGILNIADCKIINQGLYDRKTPFAESVIIYLIPYYTDAEKTNLSLYARSEDYHLYISEVSQRIIKKLTEIYPENSFIGMGDHSPIDEVNAAAKANLGIIGDNRCLINEQHGSYVFIAEIFTDIAINKSTSEISLCSHCGLCRRHCPSPEICLSELTQRKGELEADTIALMRQTNTLWGCDICQCVCPHNRDIKATPIEFFYKNRISNLTPDILNNMSDEELSRRAYGWRKRKTIERNINALFKK